MIIFIYGENGFRAKRKIDELKNKFIREIDPSGNSLAALDGVAASLSDIDRNVGTASLLASKRMLVIENIFLNKRKEALAEVLDYLKEKESKGNDNIIIIYESSIKSRKKGNKLSQIKIDGAGREKVLTKKESELFDFLSSQKFVQEYRSLNSAETVAWIRGECEQRGASISIKAAQAMAGLAGSDLWQIDNEIEKLISYKKGLLPALTGNGEKVLIEEEDVNMQVKGNFDENIFALTDAISSRNRSLALAILDEQYAAGLSDPYLINMIVRQIKILLGIRSAMDNGMSSREMASSLKLHPFIVQKGIDQVRNFSALTLKKIFSKLLEIDKNMKTGKGEARILIELLLSKI